MVRVFNRVVIVKDMTIMHAGIGDGEASSQTSTQQRSGMWLLACRSQLCCWCMALGPLGSSGMARSKALLKQGTRYSSPPAPTPLLPEQALLADLCANNIFVEYSIFLNDDQEGSMRSMHMSRVQWASQDYGRYLIASIFSFRSSRVSVPVLQVLQPYLTIFEDASGKICSESLMHC